MKHNVLIFPTGPKRAEDLEKEIISLGSQITQNVLDRACPYDNLPLEEKEDKLFRKLARINKRKKSLKMPCNERKELS